MARPINQTNDEMVQSLKNVGQIITPEVEEAMLLFKREYFLTDELVESAYSDNALRFNDMHFNISAPHMHAHCLEALEIRHGCSVLDIGCGSGYMTVLSAYLAGPTGSCKGIDIHQHIIDFCQKNIKRCEEKTGQKLDNIKLMKMNCFLPFPDDEKFDRIHVGACCPESHINKLYDLLNVGGIIVTPYKDQMLKATKLENGTMKEERHLNVRYSDIELPSDADIKEAQVKLEKEKAKTVVIPESTFKAELESLIKDETEPDVSFVFEDDEEKVWAHKVILKRRSPMFNAMFTNGMKETEKGVQTLRVEGDKSAFKELLKYIYSDECQITTENCLELLQLSNYYKVERLTCMCEKMIKDTVTIEDAATVLVIADRFNALQLKSFIIEYIIENLDRVMITKAYNELDWKSVV